MYSSIASSVRVNCTRSLASVVGLQHVGHEFALERVNAVKIYVELRPATLSLLGPSPTEDLIPLVVASLEFVVQVALGFAWFFESSKSLRCGRLR